MELKNIICNPFSFLGTVLKEIRNLYIEEKLKEKRGITKNPNEKMESAEDKLYETPDHLKVGSKNIKEFLIIFPPRFTNENHQIKLVYLD
jgi:hypothetical protein